MPTVSKEFRDVVVALTLHFTYSANEITSGAIDSPQTMEYLEKLLSMAKPDRRKDMIKDSEVYELYPSDDVINVQIRGNMGTLATRSKNFSVELSKFVGYMNIPPNGELIAVQDALSALEHYLQVLVSLFFSCGKLSDKDP